MLCCETKQANISIYPGNLKGKKGKRWRELTFILFIFASGSAGCVCAERETPGRIKRGESAR
jgi:hypothetical protein